jgi:transcriptional regulator of arginine metabolism
MKNKPPGLSLALKNLISAKRLETQGEIQDLLEKQGILVDQSTISRMLRRLGVTKMPDAEGRLIYRWPPKKVALPPSRSLLLLVRSIVANENLILLHTDPGSGALVARFLDVQKPEGLLGTIAGDDTVLVAPVSQAHMPALLAIIRETFPIPR